MRTNAIQQKSSKLRLDEFAGPGERFHFAARQVMPGERFAVHTHEFNEVFWIDRGDGIHDINGTHRPIRPGTLVFIRAEDRHGFIGGHHALRVCNVAFTISHWQQLRARYWKRRAEDDVLRRGPVQAREFRVGPDGMTHLEQLRKDLDAGDRGFAMLDRFLLSAVHLARATQSGDDEERPAWLAEACRGIAAPQWFARGVDGFVELAGRSHEHVARAARRYLGRTPTEIVNQARLAWAASRLAESEDPIVEIAYDCGLENLSHFYKLFHKRFGTAPHRYRLAQRGIFHANQV